MFSGYCIPKIINTGWVIFLNNSMAFIGHSVDHCNKHIQKLNADK